ncbi:MAG: hypothetical protein HY079_07445 [Elusimicrobia bacterium]|nr:hypothetical protein [Elusimicrobiota bacterium]
MKTLVFSLLAAALAAAPARAQDARPGPGPDGARSAPARTAPPGAPQDGPDGAPDPRPGPAGAPGPAWAAAPAGHRGSWGPWGRSGPGPELTEKMQKAEELDGKMWPLIQKVRGAKSAKEKEAVRAELRKVVAALFDAKVAIAEEAQRSHEKLAAELKARIAKRKARREELIDKKLSEAIGEDDSDDWD